MRKLILSFLCGLLFATNVYALVSGELLIGTYQSEVKESGAAANKFSGTKFALAVDVDPIPLIPVAFGLTLGIPSAEEDKKSEGLLTKTKTEGLNLGLSIKAWSPVSMFRMTPYIRLSYTVMGTQKLSADSPLGKISLLYKMSGYHFNIGVAYSVIPLVSALLEFEYQDQELTPDEFEIAGAKQSLGEKQTLTAMNILLGLKVGI